MDERQLRSMIESVRQGHSYANVAPDGMIRPPHIDFRFLQDRSGMRGRSAVECAPPRELSIAGKPACDPG